MYYKKRHEKGYYFLWNKKKRQPWHHKPHKTTK